MLKVYFWALRGRTIPKRRPAGTALGANCAHRVLVITDAGTDSSVQFPAGAVDTLPRSPALCPALCEEPSLYSTPIHSPLSTEAQRRKGLTQPKGRGSHGPQDLYSSHEHLCHPVLKFYPEMFQDRGSSAVSQPSTPPWFPAPEVASLGRSRVKIMLGCWASASLRATGGPMNSQPLAQWVLR